MSSGSRPRRAPPPRSGPDHAEVLTRATQPGSCGVTVTDDDLLSPPCSLMIAPAAVS
jgi:hypothetical protein